VSKKLSLQDLSILLVEPSLPQCRIIVEHLKSVGLDKIDVAGGGREALENMQAHIPDLVISAMYFDDMTGAELIQRIRADERLTDVPFMLVSSERDPRNLEPIRQHGVLAILPKPFKVEDLRKALYASLDYIDAERLELDDVDVEDLKVLVVDDSRFAQRHIVRVLRQLGVERISQAHNGREAAELIRDQRFDLVVTDYNMPEMDGEQLVNYIRRISDQPDLPILMVTSERDQARLASVQQAGVSALLDKPFDLGTVRELARRLLTA
jgi:two-component system chemotaxis response regulator CheY